jgi:hypothetical protein
VVAILTRGGPEQSAQFPVSSVGFDSTLIIRWRIT